MKKKLDDVKIIPELDNIKNIEELQFFICEKINDIWNSRKCEDMDKELKSD
jgi:hypothetical protein